MNARIRLLTLSFLAGFSTLAVSCGGGGSKPLTEFDFCTQKAAAECQVASTCVVTMDACRTQREKVCMDFVSATEVAPRVFVPGNVSACISKANSVYKQPVIKPSDMDALTDVCNYVFQGAVADLAACTTKYDCKNSKDICDKGHCAAQMSVGANLQCANFGAVCGSAQFCKTIGAAMMCTDKGKQGAVCDAADPCLDAGFTCKGGTCVAQAGQGESCTSNADCSSTVPYCNPYASNKCSPGLTFSAGATSCNDYGGTGSTTGAAGAGGGAAGGDGAAGSSGAAGAGGSDAAAGSSAGAAGSDAATADGSDGATD
jgi:hypothetical protein